jgi:hypothetical protein
VGCKCLGRDLGVMAEVLLSGCRLGPGAQLAEALDVGVNKMGWLETSWSQALLLIHGELFTRQSPDGAI